MPITASASADIRINDIPVTFVGYPAGDGRAFVPVPSFVINGSNSIAARFVAIPEDAKPEVKIRVALFSEGDSYFSNAGRELVQLNWNGPTTPTIDARNFSADFGPNQWSWSECTAWSDPAQALGDAFAFVGELSRAYFASDAKWIENASAAKFADLARAYSAIPEADMRAQIAGVISASPAEPIPMRQPPRPILCCHGRLLMLLDAQGLPWFRKQNPDQALAGAELLLGKYRGK